jgi:hypothetical protein
MFESVLLEKNQTIRSRRKSATLVSLVLEAAVIVLKAIIGKGGKVENVQPESDHPLLASPAVNAVKQWTYKPYVLNGTPVDVETIVTVNFRQRAFSLGGDR